MAISKLMFSDQATGPKMNENIFFVGSFFDLLTLMDVGHVRA